MDVQSQMWDQQKYSPSPAVPVMQNPKEIYADMAAASAKYLMSAFTTLLLSLTIWVTEYYSNMCNGREH